MTRRGTAGRPSRSPSRTARSSTVGSTASWASPWVRRLLLVIPPESGYGFQTMGPIPGGSTLVFTVDVLEAR
ncbi:FKBP-type peptidyl-prolyl cis-trans isomerase [Demequina litorisediminis]|uniref:FKBP-type peptidyl-prolyl cis-trans isomerase n=1 Tax=Demequina litorisediminis TaxID=1849022 RepID=UPI0024E064A3|nr:FKBP-type peptidyl-prolyl cis-trans isomerase [Demequina litorisediminis]